LLHRAARLAARIPGAELHAVHVLTGRRAPRGTEPDVNRLRELAVSVSATYQQVIGTDVAPALLAVAGAEHATQLLVGADDEGTAGRALPGRGPLAARAGSGVARIVRGLRGGSGTAARLVALAAGLASGLGVHVVSTAPGTRSAAMPPSRPGLPRWRRVSGFALAGLLPGALTAGLLAAGPWVGLAGVSLSFLLGVVVTALVGGLGPAVLSAVVGSTLLNYWFIPPTRTFRVAEPHNVITLIVFVLVAVLVSAVVQRAATLATRAARASAEARSLAVMAGGVLRGEEALPTLLEHVRTAFGMTSAALLERGPDAWRVLHSQGPMAPRAPAEADVTVPAGENLVLGLSGRTLAATDRALLRAFAAHAEGLLERDRLARAAAVAAKLEATERLRDALLAAVGHDLRTPLASATAAVSSLRAGDVHWSDSEGQELLATAEESLQRLARLVADLLDLSRLRAGVLTVTPSVVWLDEVIPPALDELGEPARAVDLRLADDLPPVLADPALLTRVLVNVMANALRHGPEGVPPALTASASGDRVEVRIIDRGPGVPSQDRERIFTPFQRLGDTGNRTGLGLGLALSRGLAEAMDGVLEPEDTPGGGLTMVLTLPAADGRGQGAPARHQGTEGQE
jgi:two-component system sensor histidine kinase KdpD